MLGQGNDGKTQPRGGKPQLDSEHKRGLLNISKSANPWSLKSWAVVNYPEQKLCNALAVNKV